MRASRRVRTPVILCLAGALAACGSSRTTMPSAGATESDTWLQSDLGTATFNLRTVEDIHVRKDTLRGVEDDLLRHVIAVYKEKGLPLTTVNAEARLVGAVEARIRRTLDGERLSRYLNCGSTAVGSRADRYEVYLTTLTQVEPLEMGTGVYTHVRAYALPGGTSGNRVRCATRGRLEREILQRLQWKVANAS